MTKQEAIKAMEKGCVVKHNCFGEDEYLYKIGEFLCDENGCCGRFNNFMELYSLDVFNTNWKVIEGKKIDHIEHASTFLKKLKWELDRLASYDIPIRVDGKLIKDVKLADGLTIEITTL